MTNILVPKSSKKYTCIICDYSTSRKSQYDRHIMTTKHTKMVNTNKYEDKRFQKVPHYNNYHNCECGKNFKHASSLWNHRKKCTIIQKDTTVLTCSEKNGTNNIDVDKDILVKMLLKNQDVMEKMIEMMPNMGVNNSHNTNSNNITNNQFNIQMFLNDHCKNAMNLTDFIQSLPITNETYDSTIENGLTKTITNMMVNGLNDLDILERPIHCTDASRKTLYVKDSDKWEKDNELLYILKGIRQLSLKQRTLISKWKEANEGWKTDDNLQSRMTHLVCNSMSQIESDEKETGKIIRSISKNVYLDNETKKGYV